MKEEYEALSKNTANFTALTPLSFLKRTADIYTEREAIIYGERSYTWGQCHERCLRMASSLIELGINKGDTVAVLAFNTPEMFEAHFFVPMTGAVLNTINTRLDAETLAYIIDFGEVKAMMVDRELLPLTKSALNKTKYKPILILIDDETALQKPEVELEVKNYEEMLNSGNPEFSCPPLEDEWQALSLNYTSGTTGKPKGVVYHHRGSYLMSMGTVAGWQLPNHPRYLYSVPMFHCNGWGHAWTMTLLAATVVCMRAFSPKLLFDLLEQHNITHFGGAPVVLNMLSNAPNEDQKTFDRSIKVMTAGAPPPAKVLESMAEFGFDVLHVYGLTETYGHILLSASQAEWQTKSEDQRAELLSRQGVRFPMMEEVSVIDPKTQIPVTKDGETIGEIVMRGNTTMKGYLKNKNATAEAFSGGWFHSGDLAVVHEDGYIQIKDRAKDIIISGGENISSVEIENVLYQHPDINEAAVVAMDDETWGEVPCAFVDLKTGKKTDEQQLIEFCTQRMARFKKPKKIIFGPLPKTATGKIQKHELRHRIK
ncbi:MAG: long-chain-fatty-acid--CoA ligase [Proteobacteria bacterium]|nr:MAG: long-chain-fatty-acid--CoA ligase [Pseudomonadota bacterium]